MFSLCVSKSMFLWTQKEEGNEKDLFLKSFLLTALLFHLCRGILAARWWPKTPRSGSREAWWALAEAALWTVFQASTPECPDTSPGSRVRSAATSRASSSSPPPPPLEALGWFLSLQPFCPSSRFSSHSFSFYRMTNTTRANIWR